MPWYQQMDFHALLSGRHGGWTARLTRGALRLLEFPYTWTVRLRNWRYDHRWVTVHRVAVPVVSVGNITTGGTGKTPMVAWLARWAAEQGLSVVLVSRGYRAPHDAAADGLGNDEARELAQRLPAVPHLQNPDRVAAAQLALDRHFCQLIVLDDGFQHRRLARDLDIVLIDALQPFGYHHLLPRGLLREPLEGLARAQVIALSRADAVDEATRRGIQAQVVAHAPQAAWIEVAHRPQSLLNVQGEAAALQMLRGKSVLAFAGLGNPAGFFLGLPQLGCLVVQQRAYPDHCHYDRDDVQQLQDWVAAAGPVDAVICTGKDLVKFRTTHLAGVPLWALTVEVEVLRGLEVLDQLLRKVCLANRSA